MPPEDQNPPVTPPATSPSEPPKGAPPATTPPDDKTAWMDELSEDRRNWIKKLQSEAVENRKERKAALDELATLKAEKEDREKKKLEEEKKFEDLYKRETAEKNTFKQQLINAEIKLYAQREGIIDLDVYKLIDTSAVKMDEKGEILGAEDVVKAFKAAKPDLFAKPGSADPAKPEAKPTGSSAPTPPPGKSTPPNVADLDKAEYEKQKKEFLRK